MFSLLSKQAKSVDGKDLGHVREVKNNYVLTDGESKYYIPTYFIQRYEDGTLWFKIDEVEAKSKFMLGTVPLPGPF